MSKQNKDTDAWVRWCQVMEHGMPITNWCNLNQPVTTSSGHTYPGSRPLDLTPGEAQVKQLQDNRMGAQVGIRYLYLKVGEQPQQPKLSRIAKPIEVPKDASRLTKQHYGQGRFA